MKKLLLVAAINCTFLLIPNAWGAKKSRFEKIELFNKVLYLIETQYYREVDTEKLIQGAIKGMMNTLDPHSSFLEKDVFTKMQEETNGEFGGLGIEVQQKDGVLYIITPIDDTPAYRAGIKAGDKIVEINHESTLGFDLEDAIEKMRGKANTSIHIGVAREGAERIVHFTLKREKIKVRPVKSFLIENNYLFLRLTHFQKNSGKEMIKAMKKHAKKAKKRGGIKGIVIDLRSNPGGLLDEAVSVSSIFLKDGIVVSHEGKDPKMKEIRYVKKDSHKDLDSPIVVLINGASASASEIVAGALQDHKRAIIMGVQSFGKGSVQNVAKIDDEQAVKLTIAQYMTPNGRKIQAIGIAPDIKLDEVSADWIEKYKEETRFIREKDLKNHLSATIETKDESERRKIEKKEERKKRIERRKKKEDETAETKKEKKRFKKYNPKEDFQVLQAINYLKSFKIFKNMDQTL